MLAFPIVNTRENCIPALFAEFGQKNLRFLRNTTDIDVFLNEKSVLNETNYLGGIRKIDDATCMQLLEVQQIFPETDSIVVFETFSGNNRTHDLILIEFHYGVLNGGIRVFVETPDGLSEIDVVIVE